MLIRFLRSQWIGIAGIAVCVLVGYAFAAPKGRSEVIAIGLACAAVIVVAVVISFGHYADAVRRGVNPNAPDDAGGKPHGLRRHRKR